jgi:hypothetical protein
MRRHSPPLMGHRKNSVCTVPYVSQLHYPRHGGVVHLGADSVTGRPIHSCMFFIRFQVIATPWACQACRRPLRSLYARAEGIVDPDFGVRHIAGRGCVSVQLKLVKLIMCPTSSLKRFFQHTYVLSPVLRLVLVSSLCGLSWWSYR